MSSFDKSNLLLNTNWYLLSGFKSLFVNAGTSGSIEIFPLINYGFDQSIDIDPFITNSSFLTGQALVFQEIYRIVRSFLQSDQIYTGGVLSFSSLTRGVCELPVVLNREGLAAPPPNADVLTIIPLLEAQLDRMVLAVTQYGGISVSDEVKREVENVRSSINVESAVRDLIDSYLQPSTTGTALFIDRSLCSREDQSCIISLSLDLSIQLLGSFYQDSIRSLYLGDFASMANNDYTTKKEKAIQILIAIGIGIVVVMLFLYVYQSQSE